MHQDTFRHKKINCVLTLPTFPRYSHGFSRLFILLYIHRQHLLNLDRPGSTGPNRSSTAIFRYNQGFIGSNRANPCHHRSEPWCYPSSSGLYRPNRGYTGGLHCARFIVETRMFPALSRFTTVFDSLPGYSRWLPVVLNILKQTRTWAGSIRIISVCQACPRTEPTSGHWERGFMLRLYQDRQSAD